MIIFEMMRDFGKQLRITSFHETFGKMRSVWYRILLIQGKGLFLLSWMSYNSFIRKVI